MILVKPLGQRLDTTKAALERAVMRQTQATEALEFAQQAPGAANHEGAGLVKATTALGKCHSRRGTGTVTGQRGS